MSGRLFEFLLNRGYRRCGDLYYRPECAECRLCVSYRVEVSDFRPTRSQRRIFARNMEISYTVGKPNATREKEEIYLRYQAHQHPPTNNDASTVDPLVMMHAQMYNNPISTREFELRDTDNGLIAFGILDIAGSLVSAVYTVFDPNSHKRSPGMLAILRTIMWAESLGIKYLHLGYYIAGHQKMEYKARFSPGTFLDVRTGSWGSQPPASAAPEPNVTENAIQLEKIKENPYEENAHRLPSCKPGRHIPGQGR